ncbi:putative olfactory ionotropic receptor IR4-like 4, partial [Homarus americanus]
MVLPVVQRLLLFALTVYLSGGLLIQPSADPDLLTRASGAVDAVLTTKSESLCFVVILTDERISPVTVFSMGNEALSGAALFEVAVDGQDANVTQAQLSRVIDEARRLRQVSWCVTVVVVSDDPAFLAAFAELSLKGRLLVWPTKLLIVTPVSHSKLQNLHKILSMTNSMLLFLESDSGTVSCTMYLHLPYNPRDTKPLRVSSWSSQQGLVLTTQLPLFPDKFTNVQSLGRGRAARPRMNDEMLFVGGVNGCSGEVLAEGPHRTESVMFALHLHAGTVTGWSLWFSQSYFAREVGEGTGNTAESPWAKKVQWSTLVSALSWEDLKLMAIATTIRAFCSRRPFDCLMVNGSWSEADIRLIHVMDSYCRVVERLSPDKMSSTTLGEYSLLREERRNSTHVSEVISVAWQRGDRIDRRSPPSVHVDTRRVALRTMVEPASTRPGGGPFPESCADCGRPVAGLWSKEMGTGMFDWDGHVDLPGQAVEKQTTHGYTSAA